MVSAQLLLQVKGFLFNLNNIDCSRNIEIFFRCGNVAAILEFQDSETRTPKLFEAVADSERVVPPRQVLIIIVIDTNGRYLGALLPALGS